MKLRKILGVFLAVLMITAMVPTVSAAGGSTRAAVAYVDENGESQTREDYTFAASTDETWTGWIVVGENVTIDHRVYTSGEVHLILTDGKTLNAQYGVEVGEMDSLTIYGQTEGTGILNAGDEPIVTQNSERNYAGIGGNNHLNSGTITINGGVVNARGSGGAAGIGGGFFAGGGTITINGGTVNAYGGDSGDGIGDGESSDDTSKITINGGVVNAYGGPSAAGIGNNGWDDGGFVVINGGTVYALGGDDTGANGSFGGAGIGGDPTGAEVGSITINGGTVTAIGQYGSCGIGGAGNGGGFATITISGGIVTATGSGDAPAIGGTPDAFAFGTVTISGGQVTALIENAEYGIGGHNQWWENPSVINLSWTNETDFILSPGYDGEVTLNKEFAVDGSNETFAAGAVEDNSTLANKKLIPPRQDAAGYHILVTDYTKGAAATSIEAETLYSGEVTFTVTCDLACVVAIDNGDGTYTRLTCTTADDEHSFSVTVTDADVNLVVVLKGDADLNGSVVQKDCTLTKKQASGESVFTKNEALQILAADVDGNGRVAMKDATAISKAVAGSTPFAW